MCLIYIVTLLFCFILLILFFYCCRSFLPFGHFIYLFISKLFNNFLIYFLLIFTFSYFKFLVYWVLCPVGFNKIKKLKVLSLELGFMGVIRYNWLEYCWDWGFCKLHFILKVFLFLFLLCDICIKSILFMLFFSLPSLKKSTFLLFWRNTMSTLMCLASPKQKYSLPIVLTTCGLN